MLLRIGLAAELLGVCTKTLRRWEMQGKITPHRTCGKHRRYDKQALEEFQQTGVYKTAKKAENRVAIYARVSASRQKEDLERQLEILRQSPFVQRATRVYEYKDIASGLNDTRKGLLSLLRAAAKGEFALLVITYTDRLSRYGYQLLREVLKSYDVDIVVLHAQPTEEPYQRIVTDIVALMHSFTGKLYRMRRGTNTVEVASSPLNNSATKPLSRVDSED